MRQLLSADKVIKLLEKHVITKDERKEFRALASQLKLVSIHITSPDKQIPLLGRCVEFLRSNGISVFFKVAECDHSGTWAFLIAGELGEIFERLAGQKERLEMLLYLIREHWSKLPFKIRVIEKLIEEHIQKIKEYRLPLNCVRASYINSDTKRLRIYCKVGWRLVEKTDALLESLKDLEHALILAEVL